MFARALRVRTAVVGLTCVVALAASVAAQAPSPARGLIWSVARDGQRGWLVGSLHVLTPDAYPLPPALDQAFQRATTLMEEADVSDIATPELAAAVAAKGFYLDGGSLEAALPPDLFAAFTARVAGAGLPASAVTRMRPWLAAITLSGLELQGAGFDPTLGIDVHFRTLATDAGKRFRPLETAAEQLDYLASLPADVQVEQLRSALDGSDTELAEARQLVAAWRAGDTTAIERLLVDSARESPAVHDTLLVARNRRWLPAIEECLTATGCFVVVGAAHMVGADGLVALLRARGYTVTPQ